MSMDDPIVKAIIGIAFLVVFVGILWGSAWKGRRGRDRAAQWAREHLAPRGFVIEAEGGIHWNVLARGQVEGHDVLIEWAHTGSPQAGVMMHDRAEVSVALPSAPEDFGLEVGPAGGVVASNPKVQLVTNAPDFDAAFRGWTDHPHLASRLLSPEVRQRLFELRGLPELKLSALTSKYRRPQPHRPPCDVRVRVAAPGLDPHLVDRLMRVGISFAETAGEVFGAAGGTGRQEVAH